MSAGFDANVRKSLAKFGGIYLAFYALFYSIFFSIFLVIINYVAIPIPLPMLLFLLLLPNVLLIVMHLFFIYMSIGKAGSVNKDVAISKCTRYFLGGALVAIAPTLAYFLVYLLVPRGLYEEILVETILYVYSALISTEWVIHRKAVGLLWLWISRYVEDHPADAGKLDVIALHPKGRLMELTFKAVFSEGEIRARAGAKLAYYATYHENEEEDERDIQTKNLAIEVAPTSLPFHSRDITDGKCPNCGAPVSSATARYCTKCGETFRGTW